VSADLSFRACAAVTAAHAKNPGAVRPGPRFLTALRAVRDDKLVSLLTTYCSLLTPSFAEADDA
jgi:hypothetical protein